MGTLWFLEFDFTNYQALPRRSSSRGFRFQTFSNPWVEQDPHLLPDYLKGVRIFESLKEPFNSEMEPCSKPIVVALSITQIVMSAAFFLLGMVDRFYVKFAYTSFTFLPCWIFPLVRNIFKGNINRWTVLINGDYVFKFFCVFMLITNKIQNKFSFKVRLARMINTKTKD